jgi:hypothetical protein
MAQEKTLVGTASSLRPAEVAAGSEMAIRVLEVEVEEVKVEEVEEGDGTGQRKAEEEERGSGGRGKCKTTLFPFSIVHKVRAEDRMRFGGSKKSRTLVLLFNVPLLH